MRFECDASTARRVASEFGTPTYVYDEAALRSLARAVASFGGPFGFTPRFAVKANPCRAVLRVFDEEGLQFDASTVWEARRILAAGIEPSHVQLTAQMLPADFPDLLRAGVRLTACSLDQLERFGVAFPGADVGVRLNPGEGSGANTKTNVAGPAASFGIWHERLDDVLAVAARHGLRLTHAHHHVGSGGDPRRWAEIADVLLGLVERLPDVGLVNFGGGFKVGRMPGEESTDLVAAAGAAHDLLREFAARTGRELHLEIEPGTLLAATAGALVATVEDVVETGADGYTFVKLDAGMSEILRPQLYGSQHPIAFHARDAEGRLGAELPVVIVGPCCESGDLLTPAPGDPEALAPRRLPAPARGDLAVIGGAGAYCASMPARHYNSIPAAAEVLRRPDGSLDLARRREGLEDVLRGEL